MVLFCGMFSGVYGYLFYFNFIAFLTVFIISFMYSSLYLRVMCAFALMVLYSRPAWARKFLGLKLPTSFPSSLIMSASGVPSSSCFSVSFSVSMFFVYVCFVLIFPCFS